MAMRRRPRLPADVPAVARLILEDYQAFFASGPHGPEDAATKAFAARHAAGRAALAHLEQLLKLAGEVGEEGQAKAAAEYLSEWRAQMPAEAREDTEADDSSVGG